MPQVLNILTTKQRGQIEANVCFVVKLLTLRLVGTDRGPANNLG